MANPPAEEWTLSAPTSGGEGDFERSVALRQPCPGHTETTVLDLGRHYRQLRLFGGA